MESRAAPAPDPKGRSSNSLLLAALLFGLLFILAILLGAWFLRTASSLVSLNVTTGEPGMADPLPAAPPDPSPLLRTSLEDLHRDEMRLSAERAALNDDLQHKVEQCRPVVVPPPSPPPPPKPQPAPAPKPQAAAPPVPAPRPPPVDPPADPWVNKDLGQLQGCWSLGQDAPTVVGAAGFSQRRENCTAKAGRICFDANGHGTREQTISCPTSGTMSCRAPVTGRFGADGTFSTTQPDVTCSGASTVRWVGRTLSCRRAVNGEAACRDSGRPDLGFPAQDQAFRRAQ